MELRNKKLVRSSVKKNWELARLVSAYAVTKFRV